MRDPDEGLAPDGTIRTGVRRDRIPVTYRALLRELVGAFRALGAGSAELHLYGSVATGTARVGASDIDVLGIDVPMEWAGSTAARLTSRFAGLSRGVEIGVGQTGDFLGPGDEVYGNQVFLRHYCLPLAVLDPLRPGLRPAHDFVGDARAARGFNGDIVTALTRWRATAANPQRMARKSLFAAAGVVSVRSRTWTTDRATAAAAWGGFDPQRATDVAELLSWAEGTTTPNGRQVDAALGPAGVLTAIAERFATEVGVWAPE